MLTSMTTTMTTSTFTTNMEWCLWLFLSIQQCLCCWCHASHACSTCFWCLFAVTRVAISHVIAAGESRRRRNDKSSDEEEESLSKRRHDNGASTSTATTVLVRSRASCIWRPTTTATTASSSSSHRLSNDDNNRHDDQGRLMAQVLVPTLLLAIAVVRSGMGGGRENEQLQKQQMTTQIEPVSLAFLFSSSSISSLGKSSLMNGGRRGVPAAIAIAIIIILLLETVAKRTFLFTMLQESILVQGPSYPDACIFLLVTVSYYSMSSYLFQPLHGVFTEGEWMVITSLSSFCMVQQYHYYYNNDDTTQEDNNDNDDSMIVEQVSFILIMSSAWSCLVLSLLQKVLVPMRLFQQGPSLLSHLTSRILMLTVVFLGTVVLLFPYRHHEYNNGGGNNVKESSSDKMTMFLFLPRSLVWLVQFLLETEQGTTTLIQQQEPKLLSSSSWPRFYWLIYYIVILVIFIPLAPRRQSKQAVNPLSNGNKTITATGSSSMSSTTTTAVIIIRKWFHLVATLLFTPVTIYAPQLQSLSYAVALSLLILVEAIRVYVPVLNRFYMQYLDLNKDNVVHVGGAADSSSNTTADATDSADTTAAKIQHAKQQNTTNGDGIVVSHMALIVGCAAPLWIANAAKATNIPSNDDDDNNYTMFVVLGLLGVICLGVGDAVGAVVGRYYGRQRSWWGRQGRTLEGSIAMLLSMVLFTHTLILTVCRIMKTSDTSQDNNNNIMLTILPSLIFMTILEAYTTQIDNLILPLAGSAVFLLSLQPNK